MKVRMNVMCATMALALGFSATTAASQSQSAPTAQAVVSAATASAAPAATADSRQAAVDALLKPIEGVTYLPDSVVGMVLSTTGKDQRIEPISGALASRNIYISVLYYADFAGQHAPLSINDSHPVIHIKLGDSPNGRVYLVKTNVNKETDNRSVKLGRAGYGRFSAATTPDRDWVIPTSVKEDRPGLWTLTPTANLAPGEYGVFVVATNGGGSAGDLYGFSVTAK